MIDFPPVSVKMTSTWSYSTSSLHEAIDHAENIRFVLSIQISLTLPLLHFLPVDWVSP